MGEVAWVDMNGFLNIIREARLPPRMGHILAAVSESVSVGWKSGSTIQQSRILSPQQSRFVIVISGQQEYAKPMIPSWHHWSLPLSLSRISNRGIRFIIFKKPWEFNHGYARKSPKSRWFSVYCRIRIFIRIPPPSIPVSVRFNQGLPNMLWVLFSWPKNQLSLCSLLKEAMPYHLKTQKPSIRPRSWWAKVSGKTLVWCSHPSKRPHATQDVWE